MADIHPVELGPGPQAFVPVADVFEVEDVLVIRLALPGVLEEDIDIAFDADGLTVRGELEAPVVRDEGRVLVQEWRYGLFERHFPLPEDSDRERLLVEVEFGVLELRIPRRA
jgi:HSP20 family protein